MKARGRPFLSVPKRNEQREKKGGSVTYVHDLGESFEV
jgi:hypothetical protein